MIIIFIEVVTYTFCFLPHICLNTYGILINAASASKETLSWSVLWLSIFSNLLFSPNPIQAI